jgi:ribosomal protein L37AE/L43A
MMGDTVDLVDYIRKEVPKTKSCNQQSPVPEKCNNHFKRRVNTELDWLCSVCVIASWLMAAAGLGNLMYPKMGYT